MSALAGFGESAYAKMGVKTGKAERGVCRAAGGNVGAVALLAGKRGGSRRTRRAAAFRRLHCESGVAVGLVAASRELIVAVVRTGASDALRGPYRHPGTNVRLGEEHTMFEGIARGIGDGGGVSVGLPPFCAAW